MIGFILIPPSNINLLDHRRCDCTMNRFLKRNLLSKCVFEEIAEHNESILRHSNNEYKLFKLIKICSGQFRGLLDIWVKLFAAITLALDLGAAGWLPACERMVLLPTQFEH